MLFQCFGMLQVREMRLQRANGLVVLRTRDGQTCSMEESFAENQKHQRAAKPLCSVNTNTVKNASVTLNDVQQLSV